MTTYAFDPTTSHLLATWPTGAGATARTVARLNTRTTERSGLHLAKALTALSDTAWLAYTDPAAVEIRPAPALRALRRPHLPRAGLLYREGDPLLDGAHDVGRELVAVGSAGVSRAVVEDVTADLDAVERARCGDLSGRARQAVALTRLDASPVQVVAADRLLHEVPMGSERLFTEVEPIAAAVAAAHWLAAAVEVTQVRTGAGTVRDLLLSDPDIGGIDVETAAVIVDLLDEGNPPLPAARCLVQAAALTARGMILGRRDDPTDDPQFTLLDPARPAPCLLERLVRAVQACGMVHMRHQGLDDRDGPDRAAACLQVFDEEVRRAAERAGDRLLRTEPTTLAS
ncbi:hypothetical protein [Pseudonocardia sp.]|uniref:hypothetical protein n=1 Tax=Pseudonocardia sp. TaxID=60912 RepID=UPI0026194DEF|nr:hypothetical protein [Pseudonocardia sp.]